MPPRPDIPGMVVARSVAVEALEPLYALEKNKLGHPRRTVGEKPTAGIEVYLEKHSNRSLAGSGQIERPFDKPLGRLPWRR